MSSPPPLHMVFWRDQISAGLHFPIPQFLRDISLLYEIPLNQLDPFAIRKALFFYMFYRIFGIYNIPRIFFRMHEKNLSFQIKSHYRLYGRYASTSDDWCHEWFLVTPPSGKVWGASSWIQVIIGFPPRYGVFPRI